MGSACHLLMSGDAVGGVFPYMLDLAAGLRAHGFSTTVALLGPAMSEAQRRQAAGLDGIRMIETGLPLDWLADDPDGVVQARRELVRLARHEDVDIVHLNTPALAATDYGVPTVAAIHSCLASWWAAVRGGEPPPGFRWRTALMEEGLRAADAVLCPSRAFAAMATGIYGIAPTVVWNGRAPPPSSSQDRAGGAAPAILTAGRLWDEGKNCATLDAAAGMIPLVIEAVGPREGPNGARLDFRHLAWQGPLDEVGLRARLARRPIFVSAALYEPFGLTVLEAAQAGCPLVLADIPTFRELWADAAVFVPPRAADGFAAALTRLAGDPAARAALGAAARRRAGRYTREAMAARTAGFYADVRRHRRAAKQTEAAA